MAEEKDDKKDETLSAEDREERVERIRHLLAERSEDAAKMVKTWLHNEE